MPMNIENQNWMRNKPIGMKQKASNTMQDANWDRRQNTVSQAPDNNALILLAAFLKKLLGSKQRGK